MSDGVAVRRRAALITGGSSGIGLEVARLLAAEGRAVALVARHAEALDRGVEAVARPGSVCIPIVADVADPLAVARAFDDVEARLGGVDLVVHGAGLLETGRFDEIPLDDYRRLIEVNYLGAVHVAREAIGRMRAVEGAHLVMIASMIAFRTFPGFAAYAPSKWALRAFHETLAMELRGSPIRLSIAYPPITDTPMVAHLPAGRRPSVYDAFPAVPAARVAEAIVRGIHAGRRRIFVRPDDRIVETLVRLAPGTVGRLVDAYVARMSRAAGRVGRR